MADPDTNDPIQLLRLHNERLTALLSDEGRDEIDRMVVLEALLMARIQRTTDLLRLGNLEALVGDPELSRYQSDAKAQIRAALTDEARRELKQAQDSEEEQGFLGKVFDKAKSVANDKVKGFAKGWMGGADAEDDDS